MPGDRDESGQGGEEERPLFSNVEPAADADDPSVEPIEKSKEVEIPLVLPGYRESSFWRRHGRGVSRVALIVIVLSTAWTLYDRFTTRGTEPVSTFSIAGRVPTPELQGIAEEFETAASRYRERMEDFDLGRLGCDGLGMGYRAVDETFMSLSERYAADRGEAADRVYEDSKRSMEEIERHFDASGCPRSG